MSDDREDGLSKQARKYWSGDRYTPAPDQQAMGMYIGVVMDDQDEQRMGRVWVYLPEISSKRFDPNSIPVYGGTAPDRQSGSLQVDPTQRVGWIHCYPIFPFFGGDDYRVRSAPDGRNATRGDVNSYGFWAQPRNGDNVMVVFDKADPASAFWIGCMPKHYRNFMVPGHSGTDKSNVNPASNAVIADTSDGLLVPVHDKAYLPQPDQNPSNQNTATQTDSRPYASTVFAQNLILAGVAYDIHRGAGISTARRESPSYVTGIKTGGWNYDSEKYQKNVDGSQFESNPTKYSKVNTSGHQLTFDDHPDHQGVRLRTSYGSELLFNDSGDTPYIYVMTAKGNVWIELVDSGDINIFGQGKFSLHSGSDINLTADNDINIEAFNNLNILVHKDMRTTVSNETHWAFQKDHFIENFANRHELIDKSHYVTVSGDENYIVSGKRNEMIIGDLNMIIDGDKNTFVGGDDYEMADGFISLEGSTVFVNCGVVQSPDSPSDTKEPKFFKLTQKPGAPTPDQVRKNQVPKDVDYLGSVVPQHQPWPLRCGNGNTMGTNGHVGPKKFGKNTNTDTSCDTNNLNNNFRNGATDPTATAPNPLTTTLDGKISPALFMGRPYGGTGQGEAPQYYLAKIYDVNEVFPASSISYSNDLLEFVKQQETYQQTPVIAENGKPTIGYGHEIKVGDVIGGTTITQSILDQIKSKSTGVTGISMSPTEAENTLKGELSKVSSDVVNAVGPNTLMTQGQFDGLLSLTRNVGVNTLKNAPEGQGIIQGIQQGNSATVLTNWLKWSYVNGQVSCDVLNRRKDELNNHFTKDTGGRPQTRNANYTPQNPVDCSNGLAIDNGVLQAIGNSSNTYGLDYGYMMGVAAVESSFDPTAQSPVSSAGGLYQFIDSTWAQYGNGGSKTDPNAAADAFARFTNDNKTALENGALNGVRTPNNTDLYMAHLLGAGGANSYLGAMNQNPNALATDVLPASVTGTAAGTGNWNLFHNPDGSSKTLQQAYDDIGNRVNSNAQKYGSCTAM